MSGTLINFGTKNPRRNLPRENRFKRAEIIFQITFLRAYLTDLNYTGIGGNQFEMPGFGIADFIWATPEGKIDAFEFKVADWKKGVGQASRYRSYASRSFLVIPSKIASRAVNHIQAFHNINLGLWSFDVETGKIIRHYTPIETHPLNIHAKSAALQILNRKLKFRKLIESN